MKINSNTIVLAKESDLYKELENVITKIAEENNISNIKQASLAVTKDNGFISFKVAEGIGTSEGIDTGSLPTGQLKARIQELEEAIPGTTGDYKTMLENELSSAKSQLEGEETLVTGTPFQAGEFQAQEGTYVDPYTGETKATNPYGNLTPEQIASGKMSSVKEGLKKVAEMYEELEEEGYSEEEEISKLQAIYNDAKTLIDMHDSMDYTEGDELELVRQIVEKGKDIINLHGTTI